MRRRNRRSRRRRNGRRYRRNRSFFRGLFKRNPSGLIGLALVGLGAAIGHRVLANVATMVFAKLGGSVQQAAPASPAASGLGSLAQNYAGVLGSAVAAAGGIFAAMKLIDDPATKQAVVSGIFMSAGLGIAFNLLKGSAPGVASFLAGDDTAAKLSAMYGLGQGGTSIMPHYAPINGMGEYFATPMSGMGEYFESGVQGLGNYTGNPDLFQAAAGYGEVQTGNTNHIDPSSDLDRQLSIAEAAAGIGSAYEAAAGYGALPRYEAQAGGMGEYFAATSGLGNIATVPTSSTWIPGTSDPQIWAGVRAIDRSQEATAEIPAGILSTPGGAGILG